MNPIESSKGCEGTRRRVPLSKLFAFGTPSLSASFLYTAISLYLLKYSTDVLLMAPAVMGMLFGVARLWDAVTDPLVGNLSDRTMTRWGRRRPWMAASAIPVAITYYAVWAPPANLSDMALTVWIGIAILAFYTSITMFNVPYAALGAELSTGHHDRSRVFGAKAVGDQLGIIAGAVSLLVMERASEPRVAAACVAMLAGALMIGGIAVAVSSLREPAEHRERVTSRRPYANFADVFGNRRARILLAVFFLEMLGYNAFVTLLPYVIDYVLEAPGTTAYFLFGAISTTLLSVPVWIRVSRRYGKVNAWSVALCIKVLVFAGIGTAGAGDLFLLGALTVVFGAASGASAVLGPSLKADVVDSDEAATGERKEGTFFAAWGFATKSSIGVSIFLAGSVLSATGFRAGEIQTDFALFGIHASASAFPLLCHLLAIPLLLRLDLDEQAHAELHRRIRMRRVSRTSVQRVPKSEPTPIRPTPTPTRLENAS